ncbi:hypothetical protein [Micromonospora globbae]|uniref:hypothetical protein n=1 Tax=Micromonospora globbae TaxID=1894969 RepID=UPI00344AEC5B
MRFRRPPPGVTGREVRHAVRDWLPYPGRILAAAAAVLLLTLPALGAGRYAGWRADLRTLTTASVVVASAGALLLAARYGTRPTGRLPERFAVATIGGGLLAGAYVGATLLYFRLVVPLEVDGALRGLPVRGVALAVLAGAFGVALGALLRRPVLLLALGVLLVGGQVALAGTAVPGPLAAVRLWLVGSAQPHDLPGCVSLAPSECVAWTYRHWPAGLSLTVTVLVAVMAALAVRRAAPEGTGADPSGSEGAGDPAAERGAPPGRSRYAVAAALVVAGLVLIPAAIGNGVRQATSAVTTGTGVSAPVGSPVEVVVPRPGRLAVFAVGLGAVRDCRAVAADSRRVGLTPVPGTVRYGDGVSYRWVGTFRLPAPGRWTVTCAGDEGEYLVGDPPRVEGLVGRLVELPRPLVWLLGALSGLLVAAHTALARRPRRPSVAAADR